MRSLIVAMRTIAAAEPRVPRRGQRGGPSGVTGAVARVMRTGYSAASSTGCAVSMA